jgi:release factor glutamine methyltransferase
MLRCPRHHTPPPQLNLLLEDATIRLSAAGVDSARLDAELLLAFAANVTREQIFSESIRVNEALRERFEELVSSRVSRTPLAYIVGRREFYSLQFNLSLEVLIPRPETETVVEAALDSLSMRSAAKVLDLGTGSGAIGLAIAANSQNIHLTATDISNKALEVARRNSIRLGLGARVEFRLADCWEVLDRGDALGRYDLIVANPPYIPDAEIDSLAPEIRDYEPRLALAGGPDGLSFYRRIAVGVGDHLMHGGSIIVEVGEGQAPEVAAIFRASVFDGIAILHDLAGIQRVVVARRTSAS